MKTAAERYDYAFDPEGDSTAAHIVRLVGEGKTVLELGPGPGAITRVLRQHAGCTVTAIELSDEAARKAAQWCKRIEVGSLDAPDWDAPLAGELFDVVVMADVLEHLKDPVRTLTQAARHLGPDGYCVISLPNIAHNGVVAALLQQSFPYRETGLLDSTHIRFFARESLGNLLAQAGLLLGQYHEILGAPQHTEFAPQWFRLNETQRQALEQNPAGNIYQFVFAAWPDTPQNQARLAATAAAEAETTLANVADYRQLLHHLHETVLYLQWKRAQAEDQLQAISVLPWRLLGKAARAWQWLGRRLRRLRTERVTPVAVAAAFPDWGQLDPADHIRLSLEQYHLPRLPLITVLVDLSSAALDSPAVRATITSLQAQAYSNYQILFAGPHPLDALMASLNGDRPWDTRWRRLPDIDAGGGIGPADWMDFVEGEYVLQLQPGDQLHAAALHDLCRTLVQAPVVSALTFNHQSSAGIAQLPGWSHEFHMAANVVGRAVVLRTDDVRNAAAKSLKLTTPYGRMLAVWAHRGEAACSHIPHTLLHHGPDDWQQHDLSQHAASALTRQRYPDAIIETQPDGRLGLRLPVPTPAPLVSILIPTRNAADLVRICIDSLLAKTRYPNYEILLIDNGSDAPDALALFADYARHDRIRVVRDDRPFNFSALNNQAARLAKGEYLLLLNNDTEVITEDWLCRMVGFAAQPGNGAIGARLWYPNNTLQHGGVVIRSGSPCHAFTGLPRGNPGPLHRACTTQRYLAVTAACLLVRASHYWQVGGLDEAYAVAFNDVDFCLRLHASGLRNIWVAEAELYHHESPSRGHDAAVTKRARSRAEFDLLESRWLRLLQHDPYGA